MRTCCHGAVVVVVLSQLEWVEMRHKLIYNCQQFHPKIGRWGGVGPTHELSRLRLQITIYEPRLNPFDTIYGGRVALSGKRGWGELGRLWFLIDIRRIYNNCNGPILWSAEEHKTPSYCPTRNRREGELTSHTKPYQAHAKHTHYPIGC